MFGLILYLIDDFRKELFAEELTLMVSRECRVGGFVDNKSIPDVCESLNYEFSGEFKVIYLQTLPIPSSPLFLFLLWYEAFISSQGTQTHFL